MTVPVSSPPQNRLRTPFAPLPSGFDYGGVRQSFAEAFARSVPSRVLANEVPVPLAPVPFTSATPSDLVEVLQLSLPIPMPVALVVNGWPPSAARFRDPPRFAASANFPFEARCVIEWGLSTARQYAYVDLAPGSIQIPVTQSLKVYAHIWGPFGAPGTVLMHASAAAYPGEQHPSPDATFTQALTATGPADALSTFPVPPFARAWDAGLGTTLLGSTARLAVALFDNTPAVVGGRVIHAPQLVTGAFVPVPYISPNEVIGAPLPGHVFAISQSIFGMAPAEIVRSYVSCKVRV